MHKSQDELLVELAAARRQVKVGGIYWHYKDSKKIYKVLNLGAMESNDKLCVIYEAQYGKKLIFVRPLKSWLSRAKWDHKIVKRFTEI